MAVLRRLWSLLTGGGDELVPSLDKWFAVEFDEEAAANYGFEWGKGPQLRRRDGSFTNW